MKYCQQHANINIGDLQLVYFNFAKKFNPLFFSRYKSFIFEFQENGKRDTVSDFDAGSFIIDNAHIYTYPVQLEQLMFANLDDLTFSYYPQTDLLNFVAGTQSTVYGTAFVTY